MTRRIVFLNLALLAVAGTLVWTLRTRRAEDRRHEAAVLGQRVAPKTVIELPPAPPVPPVAPANYLPVAENMLFSKDRNPTVVIEPPPAKPEPPMPALPRYHGQMAIGEPVALLSTEKLEQKGYHAGDEIGEFKLVSFNREKIAFEWMGKTVERKPEDLAPKEVVAAAVPPAAPGRAGARAGQTAAPVPTPPASTASTAPASGFTNTSAASAPVVTSLAGGATSATGAPKSPAGMGDDLGGGSRQCLPSDTSANGTIREGYKKVIMESMFGAICKWDPVK